MAVVTAGLGQGRMVGRERAGGLKEMGRGLGVVLEVPDSWRHLKLPTEHRIGGCQWRAGCACIL